MNKKNKVVRYRSLLSIELKKEEENNSYYDASILSTFIYSELNRDQLSKFPNLKLITTRSTGVDHIDLDYCKEKNIAILNVPSFGYIKITLL